MSWAQTEASAGILARASFPASSRASRVKKIEVQHRLEAAREGRGDAAAR